MLSAGAAFHVAVELHTPHGMSYGAAALAMLSALEPQEIDTVLSGEDGSGSPRALLFEVLAGIRRSGYAVGHDERICDAVEIAAPFCDVSDRMTGALSAAIPMASFDADDEPFMSRMVIAHARLLSERLGDTGRRGERRRVKDWSLKA